MPDITMCTGGECPLKLKCYRYGAIPSEYRQSYFQEPPFKKGKCEYLWPIEPGEFRLSDKIPKPIGKKR